MTEPDPVCYRTDCDAPNHCDWHDQPVHHCVDSMARWCEEVNGGTQSLRRTRVPNAD